MSIPENRPAISVIVPVHDIEDYIGACLDSLHAQDFEDFEIVVVDDGSTDGSSAVIERHAAAHPDRVRALRKPNGGLGDARNFGLDRARGAYVAFVDGDDLVEPDMLSSMHALAVRTGAELVICGIRNLTGAELGPYHPEPDMSVFGHSLAEEPRLLFRVDASACDKLYARELFERSTIRFPVGLAFEDVPTVYRLLAHARRVEKIDRPLYLYRRERSGSITAVQGHGYLDLIEGFRILDRAFLNNGLAASHTSALLRLHLTHLVAGRYPDLFANGSARVRSAFIAKTFSLLDEVFPAWRDDQTCEALWPHPLLRFVSTHRYALVVFCALPRRVYFGVLARLGAFDPLR